MANATQSQPLADAPTDIEPPKPATPQLFDVELLFETAEGFHIMLKGRDLSPRDAMVWAKAASINLHQQGFKPVRRDLAVDVKVDVPAPKAAAGGGAGAAGGEAIELPGDGNKPPRCSLHGPMKWVEGTNKNTNAHYEFWGCTVRGCRPKKQAA